MSPLTPGAHLVDSTCRRISTLTVGIGFGGGRVDVAAHGLQVNLALDACAVRIGADGLHLDRAFSGM
jgi:hypothetical protein